MQQGDGFEVQAAVTSNGTFWVITPCIRTEPHVSKKYPASIFRVEDISFSPNSTMFLPGLLESLHTAMKGKLPL
jgi:hypothetical protein